ncbi:MAG: uracil-DNA glycosylase [Bacteroidia bacterium]
MEKQKNQSKSGPQIEEGWGQVLKAEFESPYFRELKQFLVQEKALYSVFPPGPLLFSAFNSCSFASTRVVIIGQDPYHGAGQANGLCFSVSKGVRPPPSLVNIFKEIQNDIGIPCPRTGDLSPWARQGVLLLNATLTVRENVAGSHQGKGWETFTDAVIKELSGRKEGLVFLLWGKFAQGKEVLIDQRKHFLLKAAHPSPLARGAFFGCKHFSRTNQILREQGYDPIDWRVEH